MCHYRYTVPVVLVITACVVILLGVTGARRLTDKEVTCQKYIDCPIDLKSGTGHDYIGSKGTGTSDICLSMIDKMGLQSDGLLEQTSPQYNVPFTCWTDGIRIASYEPKKVLVICVVILAIVSAL